jgi:hypothetical protein
MLGAKPPFPPHRFVCGHEEIYRSEVKGGKKANTVRSRFTTGLLSRIFGCKSNRRKTSTI